MAAVLAAVAVAAGLAACGSPDEGEGPQGGVAPRGASAVDAAVTTGATTFQFRDVVALMADTPTDEARFAAASLAAQKDAGAPAPDPPRLDPTATPDYYGVANWANTPLIRKFVDRLPGVGPAGANRLGQYIPVAVPDTVTYPGSDYYELAVREYSEKLHSDLAPTRLRGYVQLNLGTGAGGRNTVAPAPIHYFGPLIRARRGRPVRIKFVNQLPPGPRRRSLPAGGHDDHRRRGGARRRRRRLPHQQGVAASARRARAVDQRRQPVPVGLAGRREERLPLRPGAGQRARHVVRRAGQAGAGRARPERATTRGRAPRPSTSPTARAPGCSTCTTTPTG